ncbi:hypothetical protein CC86DRAFT_406450 [Ophiobolus disseminans]|uniref:Uncharacterized protein n=1 Tax=Ophiobolus disseminans TaxID=1469910 RepID=A0A6A6ZZ82_9PLEO|nr:hypothetical protein CC86DRAFT_406450 [Ophiobolus disseminans]
MVYLATAGFRYEATKTTPKRTSSVSSMTGKPKKIETPLLKVADTNGDGPRTRYGDHVDFVKGFTLVWKDKKAFPKPYATTSSIIPGHAPGSLFEIKAVEVPNATLTRLLHFVPLVALLDPVMAQDELALQLYSRADILVSDLDPRLPVNLAGTYMLVIAGLVTTAQDLLGPLMGVSSVLWFIMRNDAAIEPSIAWVIFGMWAVVTLMYLSHQTRRVVLDKLYILLSLAFSGICLCIVALVQ